jgi:hypothetical protein
MPMQYFIRQEKKLLEWKVPTDSLWNPRVEESMKYITSIAYKWAAPTGSDQRNEIPQPEFDDQIVSARTSVDPDFEEGLQEARLCKTRRNWYERAGRPPHTQKS